MYYWKFCLPVVVAVDSFKVIQTVCGDHLLGVVFLTLPSSSPAIILLFFEAFY